MVSPETLEKHIERKIEQGTPQKEILKVLVNSGWPEEIVQQYIQKTASTIEQFAFLKMEGITKSFNTHLVLDRAELLVPAGEILGIIGESGAGKSTLLHILVGFIEPDAGDVILTLQDQNPISVTKHPEAIKKLAGFSTQTQSFYGKLTVSENIKHFSALYGLRGVEAIEKINSAIAFAGLSEAKDIIAQTLPRALQKKLDIACSIIHNPRILILDEPTADLDPIAVDSIWELIEQIHSQGTTIVIASHVLEDIERVCSKIAILRDKKIIEIGTPDELTSIYSQNYQVMIETIHQNYSKIIKAIKADKIKIISETIKQNKLIITTPNPEQLVAKLPSIIQKLSDKIKILHARKPTLKDVFQIVSQKTNKK